MIDLETFLENFLAHQAQTSYYDPVKAHEYYMRTRELKGRQKKANQLTTNQRIGWDYSKSKINAEQKKALESAQKNSQQELAKLKSDAETKSNEIKSKLEAALKAIQESGTTKVQDIQNAADSELKSIAEQTQNKIDSLPKIPDNATGSRRAALERVRKQEIGRILSESKTKQAEVISKANKDAMDIANSANASGKDVSTTAANDAKKLVDDFNASVNKAKANYKKLRDDLVAKYKTISTNELKGIKATVK